mmetsp:Transcript_7221/g.26472  ORF Transcript_7221/g.26472 Transcript_7221/m.26472 type:complete len:218 (+) Transcript_7221:224-877(+)
MDAALSGLVPPSPEFRRRSFSNFFAARSPFFPNACANLAAISAASLLSMLLKFAFTACLMLSSLINRSFFSFSTSKTKSMRFSCSRSSFAWRLLTALLCSSASARMPSLCDTTSSNSPLSISSSSSSGCVLFRLTTHQNDSSKPNRMGIIVINALKKSSQYSRGGVNVIPLSISPGGYQHACSVAFGYLATYAARRSGEIAFGSGGHASLAAFWSSE